MNFCLVMLLLASTISFFLLINSSSLRGLGLLTLGRSLALTGAFNFALIRAFAVDRTADLALILTAGLVFGRIFVLTEGRNEVLDLERVLCFALGARTCFCLNLRAKRVLVLSFTPDFFARISIFFLDIAFWPFFVASLNLNSNCCLPESTFVVSTDPLPVPVTSFLIFSRKVPISHILQAIN